MHWLFGAHKKASVLYHSLSHSFSYSPQPPGRQFLRLNLQPCLQLRDCACVQMHRRRQSGCFSHPALSWKNRANRGRRSLADRNRWVTGSPSSLPLVQAEVGYFTIRFYFFLNKQICMTICFYCMYIIQGSGGSRWTTSALICAVTHRIIMSSELWLENLGWAE